MKQLLTLIFLLGFSLSFAQNFTKEQTVNDLTFLSDNIRKYDPALTVYHPDFDELSSQVINSIDVDNLSPFEYFTAVSRICSLANEGHFLLGNWEDVVHQGILGNTYAYLPVNVKIVSGRLFLVDDYSNEQALDPGDEIVAINEVKTEVVLKKLLDATPSDGEITTYAFRQIESGFPWMYYFYMGQPDTFEFNLKDSSGKERTETITALIRSDQVKNVEKYFSDRKKEGSPSDAGFYGLEMNDNFALLTLPSFDYKRVNKYEVKSKDMYKSLFQELADVKNLIIDLRNNTGGRNEFADDMIPFIAKSLLSDPYMKKTISWEGREKIYKLPKPSKLAFQGSIYVLVNGKTFSAGASLARYLKEYGDATIIGTETGTRYEGFAAGSTEYVTLPNSGIAIGIPRYHILYPESEKQQTTNRGLLPDHEIHLTYESYSRGTDLHLEKAIDLIDQK